MAGSVRTLRSDEQTEAMVWASRAIPAAAVMAAVAVAVPDLRQHNHALLHNFPLLGHARYALESIDPELVRLGPELPGDRFNRWVHPG